MFCDIPGLRVERGAPLKNYTRFGIGGPADVLVDASTEDAFAAALDRIRASDTPYVVIGGGANLVVSDEGFRGVVLRYTAARLSGGDHHIHASAGTVLQTLVDFTIDRGLMGIHTMTGIPGWVGAAVYGNAGAYGTSINGPIRQVRFYDGSSVRTYTNEECQFVYRGSTFKRHKDWTIFSVELELQEGDAVALRKQAKEILDIRNAKYPPTMKCAGSIFKNLLVAELPERVRKLIPPKMVLGGKTPSAYFLEQTGVKGIRNGDIHVAEYHANLIYNAGNGTARQVCEVIDELKMRVRVQFGFEVEEEVQYVGFPDRQSL